MKEFTEILEINKKIMNDDDNTRLTDLELQEVYQKLEDFYQKDFDLDEFVRLCIILFNMQIFYDGNSRTILSYLITTLDKHGYYFDIDEATKELIKLRKLYSVMYSIDEELNQNDILKIAKYIYLKKDKKTVK